MPIIRAELSAIDFLVPQVFQCLYNMPFRRLAMEFQTFRTKVVSTAKVLNYFPGDPLDSAYRDLLDASEMADEIENVLSSTESGGDAFRRRKRHLLTLLKTAYGSAETFVNAFLHEISARPSDGMDLYRFLRLTEPPISLPSESILPAYCAVAYRNRILARHDIHNMYSFDRRSDGRFRLEPYPCHRHISREDAGVLLRLREGHKSYTPELADQHDHLDWLHTLFYRVPVRTGDSGGIGGDREEIDRIAGRCGCPSMSMDELIAAVDKFSLAVVDSLKRSIREEFRGKEA